MVLWRGAEKYVHVVVWSCHVTGEDACLGFNLSRYGHDHVIERRGRKLVLTCKLSNASWSMECNGSHWIGQPQKCIKVGELRVC